ESLLAWLGDETSWRDYIKNNWIADYFPKQSEQTDHERFWVETLKKGELVVEATPVSVTFNQNEIENSVQNINAEKPADGFTIELFENVNIGTGHGPLNPWLQE